MELEDNVLNEEKCSICGQPLTKFGSKQASDGIICRRCVKLLSPWLDDEEILKMASEDVKNHIRYRNKNLELLKNFKVTKEVGVKTKMLLDEDLKQLVVGKNLDFENDNPDVININQIKGYREEIEDYNDSKEYVNVNFELDVDSPWFKKIKFMVNEFPGIEKDSETYNNVLEIVNNYKMFLDQNIINNDNEELEKSKYVDETFEFYEADYSE